MKHHDKTKPPHETPDVAAKRIAADARDAADAMTHFSLAMQGDTPNFKTAAKALSESLKYIERAKSGILNARTKMEATLKKESGDLPWYLD